jgi:hypothetical protein
MAMTLNPRTSPVSLERAIRPFLPVPAQPDRAKVYFSGGTRSKGDVTNTEGDAIPTLEWEASMPPETITMGVTGFTVELGNNGDEDNNETQRSTHTVRIHSSTSPEDYVDVEVVDWVTFRDSNKRKRRLNFSNP